MTTPLEEIVSGLREAAEKATPGEWCQFHPSYCQQAVGTPFSEWDTSHDLSAVVDGKKRRVATFKHADDAAYVDRLTPSKLISVLDAFQTAERDLAAAVEERDALKATVEFYADPENYKKQLVTEDCGCCSYWHDAKIGPDGDEGEHARATLASPSPAPEDWFSKVVSFFVEHGMLDARDEYSIDDVMSALADNYVPAPPSELVARCEAGDGWNPMATCPIRDLVDLWCVYGGEEFAQYEGGASIGKLVPNRIKSKEYGFFGNQSDYGVPQRDAPDLVPVAWRKAVPDCPAAIIAEALQIPVTLEAASAALANGGRADAE